MEIEETVVITSLMQAEKALLDAKKIVEEGESSKNALRRVYHSMMLGVVALFERDNIKMESSDHPYLVELFREYAMSGKAELNHYKLLQSVFRINENSQNIKEFDLYVDGTSLANTLVLGAEHFFDYVQSKHATIH